MKTHYYTLFELDSIGNNGTEYQIKLYTISDNIPTLLHKGTIQGNIPIARYLTDKGFDVSNGLVML